VTDVTYNISRPFTRFGILPLGGRSVAVKLSHGGVWVLASTPPTAETKAAIDGLGLVLLVLIAFYDIFSFHIKALSRILFPVISIIIGFWVCLLHGADKSDILI